MVRLLMPMVLGGREEADDADGRTAAWKAPADGRTWRQDCLQLPGRRRESEERSAHSSLSLSPASTRAAATVLLLLRCRLFVLLSSSLSCCQGGRRITVEQRQTERSWRSEDRDRETEKDKIRVVVVGSEHTHTHPDKEAWISVNRYHELERASNGCAGMRASERARVNDDECERRWMHGWKDGCRRRR